MFLHHFTSLTKKARYNFWSRFITGTWNKSRFQKQVYCLEKNQDTQELFKL